MKNFVNVGAVLVSLVLAGCGGHSASSSQQNVAPSGAGAAVPPTTDATVFVLDVSGSSPITDSGIANQVMVDARDSIVQLPINSLVIAFTVGDDAAAPLSFKQLTQVRKTKEGNKADAIARDLTAKVNQLVAGLKSNAIPKQGSSNLIGGLFDASKYCRGMERCKVSYITDGVDSDLASSGAFPALPAGVDFSNMEIHMIGVGRGLSNQKERFQLEQKWQNGLKKYRPASVVIDRVG